MPLRLIASLLVLVGLTMPLGAQPPAESASKNMIANALQSLNGRFELQDETYVIELKDRTVSLQRLDNGARLLMRGVVKGQPSLQAINRFNEKVAVTTRAVRFDKGVMLEAGLDCQLGITDATLAKFVSKFITQVAAFETYLAQQPAEDDPTFKKPSGPIGKQKVPLNIKPESDDKEFIIRFPTNDLKAWETAWKIEWDMETAKQANDQGFKFPKGRDASTVLFKIKKAFFKPGQKAEWIQVLEDAHPSEFYVPYYFRGTRFYDLRGVGGYTGLNPKEGSAISQTMSKSKRVMAELRDTGPAYKHGNLTRRGEELTLWANFVASNYTYMVEYGFRDDGTIVFRHAPTGYNYFNHIDAAHMHGSFWRVGVKLGPEGKNDKNQVFVVRLPTDPKEQALDKGQVTVKEVTEESFHDWSPQEFTRIRVSNPNYVIVPDGKDRPTLPISYDLVTYPQGIARHERFKDEKFTHHDFWITRQDSPEKMYVNLGDYFFTPKGDLSPKLRKLEQENVVLWHSSSALHVPRPEDGIIGGNNLSNGQAIVYWTTFELRPRNLFLKTPIYRSTPP